MPRIVDPVLARLPQTIRGAVSDALEAPTWLKVRRALTAFESCPVELQGPETTIQILSTFTVEAIEPALCLGLRCVPCRARLAFAPLNTIEQQIFDKGSAVYKEGSLANVILWRTDELLPELYYPFSTGGAEEQNARSQELKRRITRMIEVYLQAGPIPLFLSTLPVPPFLSGEVLHSQLRSGVSNSIAQVNARIFELGLLDSRVRVLDVNRWSALEGAGYYDAQMDFVGRQPFTVRAALSLGLFLARNLRPLVAPRKKALVVDVDNTLWGGILGEDGADGLKLGHDFPGNVFLRIQREIRELRHQGVLLVLASKNEESELRQAMESLPDMLLRWEDFVCRKVNFGHKYLNVRDAADELGLALNSFALLDDSDYEREQMKTFNPEVLVLNDHGDALHMLTSLIHSDAFDVHHVSQEDRHRHEDYLLRSARSAGQQEGGIEQFLASLELQAKLEAVNDRNIDRVVQMLGKTNQFNLTTRRHGLNELRGLISSGSVSLTLRLADKFGDQGIVGVLIAVPEDGGASLAVDSFLVSCRAIGRGVEDAMWAALVNAAARKGIHRIVGEYIPTAKNGLVAALYDRFGLKRLEQSENCVRFLLTPVEPIRFPEWIKMEESDLCLGTTPC